MNEKKNQIQNESNSIIGRQGFFGRKKIRVRVIPLDIKLTSQLLHHNMESDDLALVLSIRKHLPKT